MTKEVVNIEIHSVIDKLIITKLRKKIKGLKDRIISLLPKHKIVTVVIPHVIGNKTDIFLFPNDNNTDFNIIGGSSYNNQGTVIKNQSYYIVPALDGTINTLTTNWNVTIEFNSNIVEIQNGLIFPNVLDIVVTNFDKIVFTAIII